MLKLYIDNREARLKAGGGVKLTRENPALSDRGDYTLEVELPLRGCRENLDIFGLLHRPETAADRLLDRRPFTLATELLTLSGTAHVTGCGGESVKVQLVAGRSEANLVTTDRDGNAIYIDSLDTGKIFDEYDLKAETEARKYPALVNFPDLRDTYVCEGIENCEDLALYLMHTGNDFKRQHGGFADTSVVFYPIRSREGTLPIDAPSDWSPAGSMEGVPANTHLRGATGDMYTGRCPVDDGRDDYRLDPWVLFNSWANGEGGNGYTGVAPQPRLFECLRRVLKAAGYTLKPPASTLIRNTIVANARLTVEYRDILPHWTLAELLAEFGNLFDIVVVFGNDRTAEIVPRSDFYSGDPQEIEEADDGTETDISESSETGHTWTGNVDYDWPEADDMVRVPDEVWEKADVREFGSLYDIEQFVRGLASPSESRWLFRDTGTKRVYALLEDNATGKWELAWVDQYGPLVRDADDRDTSTKIRLVPCRMETVEIPDDDTLQNIARYVPRLATGDTYAGSAKYYSVNTAINPDSPSADKEQEMTAEKRDIMEVALAGEGQYRASVVLSGTGGGVVAQGMFPITAGVMVERGRESNLPVLIEFTRAGLPEQGPFSLWSPLTYRPGLGERMASRVERTFEFIARGPLDITRPFLIRGRRYIAKKLEYTLNETGADRLVTGTFYELK